MSATRAGTRLNTDRRSERYLRAIRQLDAAGTLGTVEVDKFLDDVRREFHDKFTSTPIGIVGKCYLGDPFEVHTLALDKSIIEHYRTGQAMPGGLDRARGLAASETYLAIEVYPDRMVCLLMDGSVVALESGS